MALLSSSFHGLMVGGLEKQGFPSRNCRRFSVKCSIDGKGPAYLGSITKLKDSIAMAAEGKKFLLFNNDLDETAHSDITTEHAISAINRPTTSVHRYTIELKDALRQQPKDLQSYYMHCYSNSNEQELYKHAADGRYFTRFYLGNESEEIFTEFDDMPYNYTTHMLDLRLRKLDANDIDYLSNIENPKRVEIREGTDIDDLIEKCKLINPENGRGSVVVTVNPYIGIPLQTYVEKFITAAVEATWVVNPVMFSPTLRERTLRMHSPEECRKCIHTWHNHLRLGGAQFGGLMLDYMQQVEVGEPNPVLSKAFLQECGYSFRIIEEEEHGAMPNGSVVGCEN